MNNQEEPNGSNEFSSDRVAPSSGPVAGQIRTTITDEDNSPDFDINYSLIDLENVPKISPEEGIVHLIKSNIGAGLLSLPYAFYKGGLLSCFFLFWIIGAMSLYGMHSLIAIYLYHRPRLARVKLDYGDVVRFTLETVPSLSFLSKYGKFVVDFFIIASQLGFCCVYFVFVPVHVAELLEPIIHVPVHLLIFFMFLLLIPFVCIKTLRVLSPVSLFANILILASLLIVFQYILRDPLPIQSLPLMAGNMRNLIFFVSTTVYSFEGICFVLPMLQRTENTPLFRHRFGVLNTSLILCSILFFTMGFYGFLRFGRDVKTSIALNLPGHNPLYIFTNAIFIVAVFLTYPLQFYIPCSILWPRIRRRFLHEFNENRRNALESIWRVIMMALTAILAALVPNIGLVISLIGSFCCTCLALIFPPSLEMISFLSFNKMGKFRYKLFVDMIILSFGTVVFFYGTFSTISNVWMCMGHSSTSICGD